MNYQHILVAIDESPVSANAIQHASDLAQVFSSQITLVCVVAIDPFLGVDFYKIAPSMTELCFDAERQAQRLLEHYQQQLLVQGVQVRCKLLHELHTSTAIIQYANNIEADLIVIAAHERSGFRKYILGSVAETVLNLSFIPVLIVK